MRITFLLYRDERGICCELRKNHRLLALTHFTSSEELNYWLRRWGVTQRD